ncbi:hypothetical protein BABINDRAFT_162200 [Babjeviella inositovora NRRL Y-12698]|uniref:Uncharacterized protein n=1 Tax=Babjeviella inositovora NRRL Y-12698 TaxID=984486 RepID=A0A1E3QN91_9ASCO|nr:uncharacterized protein BABINDRAFT_162200 [Babjeviella inositovora NRRL Y-12698]ODQ79141.1 hypothetical protein BABINDRAFT_162200 [Babjeviella inositovora NRRL Y-12698]
MIYSNSVYPEAGEVWWVPHHVIPHRIPQDSLLQGFRSHWQMLYPSFVRLICVIQIPQRK